VVGIAKGFDIALKGATGRNQMADGFGELAIANFNAIEPLAQREENIDRKGFFGFTLLCKGGEQSVSSSSHGSINSVNNSVNNYLGLRWDSCSSMWSIRRIM